VPSKDQPIGAYTFSLEDFVPNRIETSVKVDQKTWKPGLEYPVQVSAQHLFGAPAADRQAKADVVLRRGEWAPEGWKEYKFGNDAEYTPEIVALGEAETNGQGVADFTFKYAPQANVQFPLSATVIGQVFELGGRGVNARETVTLLPSDILLGIAAEPKDGGAQVHVAAVTPDGTPAALGQVKISLEREYWIYNVRRFSDSNQPWWVKKFTQVATQDVLLSEGRGSATLPISGWGYFRVKVYAPETPVYSTISFYSYWDSIEIVESARPSLIKLTLDKPEYSVGEEVRLRIESPFNGKGIVVLQDEGLQRMLPVQIVDNAAEVRFHVDRNSVPNVWAEVTVVHEVREDAKQVYPFSSFAMVNVPVHDPERKIQVTFPELPEEVRPAQEVSFTLTTADAAGNPVAAEVTLAAVDEGIHGITGYKTPEPYEWLMRPRQPDYRRAHYYDRVAYDFERPAFGGDIEARLGKLAPPVDENWIKPLALWSGVIRTNADGRGTVSFTLPEYNGKLRLVAVAATATAVGADDANVFVRRPYMLRTSMPRFTLPNDQFQARAVIFNTTDQAVKAELSWSAGGTLTGTPGNVTLDVAPKGEASTLADFQATDNIGQGQIDWQVVIRDAQGNEVERLQEQAPLPVRPPAAFQSRHLAARVLPGESQTFQATEFVENDLLETKLHVSANPVWRLKESLDYVVQYPYGCVEQTTSACLPLYLLRSVQELTTSSLTEERRVENYLQAGIRRLFSMQTASGGLSFWPGGTEAYPYGSVYALHFLTLVKNDRELTVPAESFNKLQAYVRREANNWQDKSSDALYRRAYAHYVLALGSDLKAIEQIDRFNDMTIPRAARYLLAAAVATSTGSMDRAKEYLAAQPSEPYTVKLLDGTLNSEIRNQAVELLAKVQMGDLADAEGDVNALLAFLEANRHGNTQESAFIIAALGSYLNKVAGNIDQVGGTVNGPDGSSQLAGMSAFSDVHGGPGGVYTVTNTGQTPLYVNFTTAGMPTQPQVEPYANEIAIERHYYAQEGEELDAAAYSQGAMYVVGLRLDAGQVSRENLVVADLLPAGFEIENPRLEQEALAGMESEEGLTPAHLEIRDDRLVVAFDEVPSGVQWFYYAVRAVTPGAFQQPAVTAECMYDPRIRAASGVREVTVQPRAEQ
ncbi:MAG: hypothetical protein IT368_04275, partial [Candidatus Hydrogenedentes bacterium]|nr:hypothetical protein [Candidatus Hydrogenedentota bacterium]